MTGNRPASSGLATNCANCLSWDGCWVFQKSFLPSGTISSLNSGLPSRETCFQGPLLTLPPSSPKTEALWRLALVQTPIVGFFLVVPSEEIGTLIAMVCTFRWLVALTPG